MDRQAKESALDKSALDRQAKITILSETCACPQLEKAVRPFGGAAHLAAWWICAGFLVAEILKSWAKRCLSREMNPMFELSCGKESTRLLEGRVALERGFA